MVVRVNYRIAKLPGRTLPVLVAVFISMLMASKAHALDLIGTQVTTYNGPTYALSPGGLTITATSTDFSAVSATNGATVTPPNGVSTTGSLNLNINLIDANDADTVNTQGDFLALQVSVSGNNTLVFNSTDFVDFGTIPVGGGQTKYWFAFYSDGTPSSPAGDLIGGYISKFNTGSRPTDVKVFDVTAAAPTPSAAIGGGLIMAAIAGWKIVQGFKLGQMGASKKG